MKLSKRLFAIASYVNKNQVVADIGTDHGHIPIFLVENNICSKVIATDVSYPSLLKTIQYVSDLDLQSQIETRHGDGLDVINPHEVDTVIIAGMGGILIKDILEKNKEVVNTINNFIFQPMIGSEELRKYLINNNFVIEDEKLVYEEGKYYEIIYAKHGEYSIDSEIYFEIGEKLIENKDPLLPEFINYKINYNKGIIKTLDKNKGEKINLRVDELSKKISEYKGVLDIYESISDH